MDNYLVTEKFNEYMNSLNGCDGGNIKSQIWFCGIERGDKIDLSLEFGESFYSQKGYL